MNLKLELFIAFRYLQARKTSAVISLIAWFSFLGVTLGVAALIIVMAVMNGFHKEISLKMTGFNGDITVYGNINNYRDLSLKFKESQNIKQAIPLIEKQVMVTANNAAFGVIAKAMDLENLKKKELVSSNIIEGNISDFGENKILIGYILAQNLGLTVGDELTVITTKSINTLIGVIPRSKTYKIAALFKTSMYLYDSANIFIPLQSAQKLFQLPDLVTHYEIMIKDPNAVNILMSEIASLINYKYNLTNWQITNASFFQVLKTERVVMFLILTLIIIVAAFNIISSMAMLVKEKSQAIAILRTMGMNSNQILRIFLICGASIGILGTFVGGILGISFATNIEKIKQFLEKFIAHPLFDPVIYYLSELPSDLRNNDVIKIMLLASILSIVATIYPAIKAAKTDPALSLRYE